MVFDIRKYYTGEHRKKQNIFRAQGGKGLRAVRKEFTNGFFPLGGIRGIMQACPRDETAQTSPPADRERKYYA